VFCKRYKADAFGALKHRLAIHKTLTVESRIRLAVITLEDSTSYDIHDFLPDSRHFCVGRKGLAVMHIRMIR